MNISEPSAPGISTMTDKMTRLTTTMTLILVGAFISFITLGSTRVRNNLLAFVPNFTNIAIKSNQSREGSLNNNIHEVSPHENSRDVYFWRRIPLNFPTRFKKSFNGNNILFVWEAPRGENFKMGHHPCDATCQKDEHQKN